MFWGTFNGYLIIVQLLAQTYLHNKGSLTVGEEPLWVIILPRESLLGDYDPKEH